MQITNGVRQHYPFLIFSLATIFKGCLSALIDLHAIICLIQTGMLWWNGVAVFVVVVVLFGFFFIEEKRASPKYNISIDANISIDVQMVNGVKHR